MKIRISNFRATFIVTALAMTISMAAVAEEVSTDSINGIWEHISTSSTPDGARDAVDTARMSWTFNADGSGEYKQTVMGRDMGRAIYWRLDGTSIVLSSKKGGKAQATYSIVKADTEEMIWKNEKLGDYYHVEKK
jgi:hypothetical protein